MRTSSLFLSISLAALITFGGAGLRRSTLRPRSTRTPGRWNCSPSASRPISAATSWRPSRRCATPPTRDIPARAGSSARCMPMATACRRTTTRRSRSSSRSCAIRTTTAALFQRRLRLQRRRRAGRLSAPGHSEQPGGRRPAAGAAVLLPRRLQFRRREGAVRTWPHAAQRRGRQGQSRARRRAG